MRIAKHLPGPRRDSDHHHHRGCACLSPLPWVTLSLAVAVEVGHDCAYLILQAGKLRQGQAQGPAHAREEAASWVEVAEVAQGHPASHVATPPSFQMQTSGGSGLTNGHRAGWTLGAHVRYWPCAGEPRRGRGPVRQPPRLHPAMGAWWSSSGWRRHAGPPRLTSSVNRHLTAATPKQESSPGLRVGVAASCRAAWQAVSALPLDWGRLSEAQRAPLTAGLQIEKHPGHPRAAAPHPGWPPPSPPGARPRPPPASGFAAPWGRGGRGGGVDIASLCFWARPIVTCRQLDHVLPSSFAGGSQSSLQLTPQKLPGSVQTRVAGHAAEAAARWPDDHTRERPSSQRGCKSSPCPLSSVGTHTGAPARPPHRPGFTRSEIKAPWRVHDGSCVQYSVSLSEEMPLAGRAGGPCPSTLPPDPVRPRPAAEAKGLCA